MHPLRHRRAAHPGSRAARAPWLACALALAPALSTQPRASAQSRDADAARPSDEVPRGAPAPSTWNEAEARMDADGAARAVDILLGAAAAGGWIETRRGELVALELAILRRVRGFPAQRQKYWTERAGLPAAARLFAAGDDERNLARIVREMPATREAGLAALRLCDAALERGEADAAADWLARAAAHGAAPSAVAARGALLDRRAAALAPRDEELAGCAVRAVLERRLAGPRHQRAAGVGLADGGFVAQHGDILCSARRNASGEGWTLAEHDLRRALEARHGLELPPAHGSSGMPGVARPALAAGRPAGALVVAAVGRAEDERGNALACWRLADLGPELLWSSLDEAARAPELAEWTLEHSAFPLVVDGRVVELVRAWPDRVDDARVRTWLVSRSVLDGKVLSTRLLDEGPVERAALREANALQPWRADQAPAPWMGDGSAWLPTGTGALWRVGLAQLEPLERLWSAPVPEPRAAATTVDGLGWAPREGGWRLLPALAEAGATEAAWPGLVELVGPGLGLERMDSSRARLARAGGSAASAPFAAPKDARPALLARPGRIWVASQGRAHLHDEALRRLHSVDLPGPAAGLPAGQLELGWIAVPGGAWLVRSGSLVFVGG